MMILKEKLYVSLSFHLYLYCFIFIKLVLLLNISLCCLYCVENVFYLCINLCLFVPITYIFTCETEFTLNSFKKLVGSFQ